ncbi:hypothetical protein H5410_056779, partial [Solanum commersonii]
GKKIKRLKERGTNESISSTKEKGFNSNKAQSPLNNLNFEMQYRSSTELANQFNIKREQLANKHNDKANKEHAPIAHKRKNSEDFIPQQGKRKRLVPHIWLLGKDKLKKAYFNLESPFKRKELNFLCTTLGSKHLPRKVKRKSVLPATSPDQLLEEQ